MLFCCLWRNVETYCKHFAVLSHRQQTPPLTTSEVSQHACVTYVVRRRRIYNLTGSSVNSSEAIYWFRIAVLPTPPAFDALIARGFLSEYCYAVWFGKTRMVWLPGGKKNSNISLFILTEYTNVTDTQTDTHRMMA